MASVAQQKPPASQPPASSLKKLSDKEKNAERARELFADAANAQNNGAYPLAIENWKKLLQEYPSDPSASSAHHFLGVCYLQQDMPDFNSAVREFKLALQNPSLKQREEALVNLGWSLYQSHFLSSAPIGKEASADSPLREAAKVLALVVSKYPDGSFLDKALYYAAEAEARLGRSDEAVSLYRQLIQNKKLENSTVRPDAIFGLGLTYEELKQPQLAIETYESFLQTYSDHSLKNEVLLRTADLALIQGDAKKSLQLFDALMQSDSFATLKNADYVLYRFGFAMAKDGRYRESAKAYQRLAEEYPNSQYAKNSSLAAGQSLMREKKYDEAVLAFEQLLPLRDERAAEAAHWICQIKMLQGKEDAIAAIAKDALTWGAKTPSAPLLYMDLADSLNTQPATRGEAKKIYERIANEFPDDALAPRAVYNAAFCGLQLGELADAQRWSEAFAKRYAGDPLAPDVAYIRAESTLQLGQHESAINAFEQLIAAQPSDPLRPTWEGRLAVAHYLAGQWEKAIATTERLLKQSLGPAAKAEALFLQGASQLKTGKLGDSIRALEQSLAESSDWPQADEASMTLAEAMVQKKDDAKAIAALEGLVKRTPQSRLRGQAEFRIGQIAAGMGDLPRALRAYDSVIDSSKESGLRDFATYGKAFVLIQQEAYQPALELVTPVAQSDRTDSLGVESKIARAICLRQLGHADEALATLAKLSTASLSDDIAVKVLYEQSLSLVANEKHDEAIAAISKLQRLLQEKKVDFPLADKAQYELAWTYKTKGDTASAIQQFEKLVEQYPDSPLAAEAYFHVGQAEYDSSKYDRAIQAYQVAASKTLDSELQEKSLYKMGWAFFQQGDFPTATTKFRQQLKEFPKGELSTDARFMIAESLLKQSNFADAWKEYEGLRSAIQKASSNGIPVGDQVEALTLLHGGQSARELKRWKEAEAWTNELVVKFPESPYRPIALYELAYARQNLKRPAEAINAYNEVAENNRNELGARSRFMIGEVLFAERDFAKAIAEFQKVMYGYGATQAPEEIKNWQARSAFEAGRCSEVLIADLSGERKQKAIDNAMKFYEFVVQNHASHELASKAAERVAELRR
jgi:TolA-binding protein